MQVEEEEERRGGARIKLRHFLEDTSVRAALRVFFGGGVSKQRGGPSEGGFHSQTRAM